MHREGSLHLWFYIRCPCSALYPWHQKSPSLQGDSSGNTFCQCLTKTSLWHGKAIAPVNKLVVICRRNYTARLCLTSKFCCQNFFWGGNELLTFLCPWSMRVHHCLFEVLHALAVRGCTSRNCTPGEDPGLAAANIAVFLEHVYSGILLVAICCLVLFGEEISLQQERLDFVGLHQLSMRTCRNLGQLMPTPDGKPVQHRTGPSQGVSQASTSYQPTAARCSALS